MAAHPPLDGGVSSGCCIRRVSANVSDCGTVTADNCSRPMPLERWCMRRRKKCRREIISDEESAGDLINNMSSHDGDVSPCLLSNDGCVDPCGGGCETCLGSCDMKFYPSTACPTRVTGVSPSFRPFMDTRIKKDKDFNISSCVPPFLATDSFGYLSSGETVTTSVGRCGAPVNFLADYDARDGISDGVLTGDRRTHRSGCVSPSSEAGRMIRRPHWSFGTLSRPFLCLVWLSLMALLVGGASASIMGDGCDWSGSGLDAEIEASRGSTGSDGGLGVRPVYLRCSQGAVSWAYPRGALRVLLRLSGGSANEEFRGCVRLGRTWKGARLFLAGARSLHSLFPEVDSESSEPSKGNRVRCFQSRNGLAALYVEATPGGVSPRGRTVASFEYHLQPLPSGVKSFDPSEECRPCTMEEMTHAFCSSDLVTRGTIRSVESRDDPENSELRVRVTKLIRRNRAPPPPLEGDPFDEDDELEEGNSSEDVGDEETKKTGGNNVHNVRGHRSRRWWNGTPHERGVSVTLHVPTHCGVRHGAGEFVFMAQRKLGQLRLRCAPRLEDWAELARKSNRMASSPCVLQA